MKGHYSGRERANSYAPTDTHTCVVQHVIRVWIGPGARGFESTVSHRFVKHGFKVLLHLVVDGPLQDLPAWFNELVRLYLVYPCILSQSILSFLSVLCWTFHVNLHRIFTHHGCTQITTHTREQLTHRRVRSDTHTAMCVYITLCMDDSKVET